MLVLVLVLVILFVLVFVLTLLSVTVFTLLTGIFGAGTLFCTVTLLTGGFPVDLGIWLVSKSLDGIFTTWVGGTLVLKLLIGGFPTLVIVSVVPPILTGICLVYLGTLLAILLVGTLGTIGC